LTLLFAFAGCGKPGMLKGLADSKLGVTWKGEPSYSALVSREIKKRTKLMVLDDQNLPELADYQEPDALSRLQRQHKLDYILVCTPVFIGPVQQESFFSVREGVRISVEYKRQVKVAYKLLAVPSGEMLLSGVSEGEGKRGASLRFDSEGASGRLPSADDQELLSEAVADAIRRSELL
jgi:hypothetical protein